MPSNQLGIIFKSIELNSCPNSKAQSTRNQHTQIIMQPLFWQWNKPAVIRNVNLKLTP